jgi:hypothetical protein
MVRRDVAIYPFVGEGQAKWLDRASIRAQVSDLVFCDGGGKNQDLTII